MSVIIGNQTILFKRPERPIFPFPRNIGQRIRLSGNKLNTVLTTVRSPSPVTV